ncbi:MAG: T9SS type A sorting domain-containing protein [Bacteroidota bacterium]|nr:T9SS type A sorting domain-containing protein [Bacteroidota bacterium]
MKGLGTCIVLFVAFLVFPLGVHVAEAQTTTPRDPGAAIPGREGAVMHESKPQARIEYFLTRRIYPGGEIPVGARAQAFLKARAKLQSARGGRNGVQNAAVWRNVGPFNIGGRILAAAVNPKNPKTIFIGAADGGTWRSHDGGRSWHSVSDDWPAQAMGAIAIDPVDTNIVYAGTGEANFGQHMFDGGGMMKSTDGGTTWRLIGGSTLPPYARASDIVIDPVNTNTLYVAIPDGVRDAAQEGIYKSTDGGETWDLILDGRMTDIVLNPKNPNVLYTVSSAVYSGGVVPRTGLFVTSDGGTTWEKRDIGVPDTLMGRTSITICPSYPDVLYLGVSELTGTGRTQLLGVFKTTDAGLTWSRLPVPFDYMVSQGWYDNIVGVHPTNPDIVYAGGVKLIRSSDGGMNWERIPDQGFGGLLHVDQHAIEFNPENPDEVYIGNDGGFYILRDEGKTVIKSDLGLSITQFIGGAMHPTSDAYLLGGTQDNGTMTTSSAPMWETTLYGDGGNGAVNPRKPNVVYTTMETLKFWRSEDFGRTWTQAMGSMPLDQSLFYIDFAMDMTDPDVLYLGTYKMYKTTNGGDSWRMLRDCFFPTGTGSCYYISAVSVAPYDGRYVFAGATGGMVGVSQDGGQTWSIVRDSLPLAYCSSVRSFEPGVVYATYSRYGVEKVWRSTDWGNTWRSINGDLPDIPVNDIIRLDGKLIIGTDIGCFISEDEGRSWLLFGVGMPTVSVQKLRYSPGTGTLRAITHGRGMYDLAWNQPPPAAPIFLSSPDTTTLEKGQPFLYAPVVSASPPATFRLLDAPSGAIVDTVLGFVRWSGNESRAHFTLEARNSVGSAVQVFSVETRETAQADWRIVHSEPMETQVYTIVAPPPFARSADVLWVGRDSAVVSRSTDGGVTWQDFQLPGTKGMALALFAFDRDRIVAGTRSGQLFKTTDGGRSWRVVLSDIAALFGDIHFWNENEGIIFSRHDRDSADVYLTRDGGETWEKTGPRIFAPSWWLGFSPTITFIDRQCGWVAAINQGQSIPRDAAILRTTDGGLSWTSVTAGTRFVSDIGFLSPLKGFCVDPVYGRVRRTINGGISWITSYYPMNGSRPVAVHCDSAKQIVWIVTDSLAWVSTNEGNTWTQTRMVPTGAIQTAVFDREGRGWAVSRTGVVQALARNPISTVEHGSTLPSGLRLGYAYPNPVTASDAAVLPFTISTSSHVTLTIHDCTGRQVVRLVDDTLPSGDHVAVWEPGKAVNGVYYYTVSAGSRRAVGRIVLMR